MVKTLKFQITILIGLVTLIVVGFAFYFYSGSSFFVVAKVDNEKIYLSDYQKSLNAAIYFYDLVQKNNPSPPDPKKDREYRDNLNKFILQTMIEDKIIESELKNNFNTPNLTGYINQKIEKALSENQNIAKDVQLLYNLDLSDFKKLFLQSAALREILNEEMRKQSIKNVNSWFSAEEQKYDVKIYLNNLKWNKEKGTVE